MSFGESSIGGSAESKLVRFEPRIPEILLLCVYFRAKITVNFGLKISYM